MECAAKFMISDYYKNLPKKRMGSGAIIMNAQDEVLIVKPSYRDYWILPGGTVEENESPREACLREVREEIGLDLKEINFLCVDYTSKDSEKNESLQFIFFGGRLNESEIKKIKLDGKEIVEYKFKEINETLSLLGEKLKQRVPRCLEALKNNMAVYLEDGK